jgi:hypothetical protein
MGFVPHPYHRLRILPNLCSFASSSLLVPYRDLATNLGAAFQNRPDLRPVICRTLSILCLQNRLALKVNLLSSCDRPSNTECHSITPCVMLLARHRLQRCIASSIARKHSKAHSLNQIFRADGLRPHFSVLGCQQAAGRVDMFAPGSPPCTAALHSAGGSDEDLCEDSPSFETGSNVPAAYSADIASACVSSTRVLPKLCRPLIPNQNKKQRNNSCVASYKYCLRVDLTLSSQLSHVDLYSEC